MTLEEELALIRKNAQQPAATGAAVAPAPAPAPGPISQIDKDLGLPPGETGLQPIETEADTIDVMAAAWSKETVATDAWSYSEGLRQDLMMEMWGNLTPDAKQRIADLKWDQQNNWMKFQDLVVKEVAARAAASVDDAARFARFPQTPEAFEARITEQRKREYYEAQAILDQDGGGFAEFVGAGARSMTDEISLATMFLGGGGKLSLGFVAKEAGLSAFGEGLSLPREYRVAEELDLPEPDPVSRIAMGAVLGGGLAGAFVGVDRALSWNRARREGVQAATPDGVDPLDAEAAVDAAYDQMQGNFTVSERLQFPDSITGKAAPEGPLGAALSQSAPGTLPSVPADAPENWGPIRNGIFAGESGGDYNALFGYSNRKGGQFSRVKLTEMTVNEAIAFSDPRGPYAQWVKGKIGRVATPMGAYQIVGTTLRAAKRGLMLNGDELMTPELQEQLGIWIYKQQGTGAWEGYRGPRDTFTGFDPDASAPPVTATTRGYTREGQVSAGDGMRVDVEYEVVDLKSLTRASGDLQPRDRTRGSSDAWIADTAARLDPAQLLPSPTADRGAPIVGPDSIIESGNGRFGAIERAYALHPDRAQEYRFAIEEAGFAVPDGVEQPILIARRKSALTDGQRRQFVIEAQDSGVAVMTPTETARAYAKAMTPQVLGQFDPAAALTDAANAGFVRGALSGLPRSARNAMFDASGMLNRQGERQLREALFARAWSDPDVIEMFAEADAGELRGLLDALEEAVPSWAALKADIEAGQVRPEMDISAFVLDAMRLIAAARKIARNDTSVMADGSKAARGARISRAINDLLDQPDLVEGAVSPLTVALVRKFWADGRAAPTDKVSEFLRRYADDARKAGAEGGLFDGPTPRDVLQRIDPASFADLPENYGTAKGFAQPGRDTAADAPPDDLPVTVAAETITDAGFDAGARSIEAEEVDAAIREELEAEVEGPFGPVYSDIVNDPEAAIERLLQQKTGEVPFAMSIPEIGPVRFIWGSTKLGLRHVLEKHGEAVVRQIPQALRTGQISRRYNGRIDIIAFDNPKRRTVIRLDWDGDGRPWVVTSHDIIQGTDAQPGRTSNGLTDAAPPSVPDATARTDNTLAKPDLQDQISAEMAAARADLEDGVTLPDGSRLTLDDIEMQLDDGTRASLRAFLDDLDSDAAADAVLQACGIGGDQ